MKEVLVLLGAEIDLQRIYAAHFNRGERAGERISQAMNQALSQLSLYPESGPAFQGPFRRLVVLRSQYAIYYRIEPKRVAVAAIVNVRQDPAGIIVRLGLLD